MTRPKIYAICLKARPGRLDGVLMVVDEKEDAEAIAFELRQRGQDVEVREYSPREEAETGK
ncbi:MAG: hypothetical protein ACYDH6_22150 [Acidimicrobiales bacterium]